MKRLICTVRSRSSFRASARPVDIHKKKLIQSLLAPSETGAEMGIPAGWVGTPSPLACECLVWRGFCKNAAQNIEPQRFRGQNLDFKELIGGLFLLHSATFASTMMGLFSKRRKVRCHIEGRYSCGKPLFSANRLPVIGCSTHNPACGQGIRFSCYLCSTFQCVLASVSPRRNSSISYARVRRSLYMDGYASGKRHASQSLALPELRRVVFRNVVV